MLCPNSWSTLQFDFVELRWYSVAVAEGLVKSMIWRHVEIQKYNSSIIMYYCLRCGRDSGLVAESCMTTVATKVERAEY